MDLKQQENKDRRTEAFDNLSNKDNLTKSLFKTSLCRSIFKKEPCPHGESCRFAHSIQELRTSSCLFGGDCRFVKFSTQWNNIGNKVCTHIHPDEERKDFLQRIGVDITLVPLEVCKEIDNPPQEELTIPQELDGFKLSNPVRKRLHPIEKVANAVKSKTISPPSSPKSETVIRVPLALSQQALEMALKSGKQNIRVEII